MIAGNDRAIPPQLEKDEAANIKATSITVPANHLAMLSHPREVAELIEQAAASPLVKVISVGAGLRKGVSRFKKNKPKTPPAG